MPYVGNSFLAMTVSVLEMVAERRKFWALFSCGAKGREEVLVVCSCFSEIDPKPLNPKLC